MPVIRSARKATTARRSVKNGVVALRIEASPESIVCSAHVMSTNGTTMFTTERTASLPMTAGSRGRRTRRTTTAPMRSSVPKTSRHVTRERTGSVATPILMKR